MQAVLLVGGEGTRLRPLTCTLPKPMVPILNRPFLEHMIAYLASFDIRDIILALCYLPDRIQAHFGDGSAFGVRLTYVVEEQPLGTAGAVRHVAKDLQGTCLVFNADVLTDFDLTGMIRLHRQQGAKVTIGLTPVEDPTRYGLVELGSQGRVLQFIEKPSWDAVTTNLINAGIYVLEPEVLASVPANTFYMFERGLFPDLLKAGEPVFGYACDAYWIDIGTPQQYLAVHHDLLLGKMNKRFPGQRIMDLVWAEDGSEIHPSARLVGPILLGRGCRLGKNVHLVGPVVLGDGCQVGEETIIEEAVIWEGTQIGAHAVLQGCLLADRVRIGDRVWLRQRPVIGSGAVVGSGNRLEQGLKLWPGKHLEEDAITF